MKLELNNALAFQQHCTTVGVICCKEAINLKACCCIILYEIKPSEHIFQIVLHVNKIEITKMGTF